MTHICSPVVHERSGLLRYGRQDALLVGLTLGHAAVLLLWPSLLVVALGFWWNTNTISHNFIHRPFFRQRWLNATYSVGLSLLLGLPQSVWRDRHLAHHAGVQPRLRRTTLLWAEIFCVATLWGLALWWVPWFVAWVYLPGFLLGLGICAAHGHYEHLGGGTISHYGWLYNLPFLNDGYHVEHHAEPSAIWRRLREPVQDRGSDSPWPAVLRWLPARPLDTLERLVLRSKLLQAFVLHVHRRAWRRLAGTLGDRGNIDRVGIVGGGLFPRTALILAEDLPEARFTIIDASHDSLQRSLPMLRSAGIEHRVTAVQAWFDPAEHRDFDLLVFPLSYHGNRRRLRTHLPAPAVLLHDWIWNASPGSVVVSVLLLKRMSLHRR